MHLGRFFFNVHEIQTGLRTDSLKCIQASISSYVSDDECWIIDAIVLTIETYENRTVTPISISDNSVQSTVTNNNSVQLTVIDLVPIIPNSRIALFPYSNIQGNLTINVMAQMIKIGPLIYMEKLCLIAVINMVNYIVDFYTLFILLLF